MSRFMLFLIVVSTICFTTKGSKRSSSTIYPYTIEEIDEDEGISEDELSDDFLDGKKHHELEGNGDIFGHFDDKKLESPHFEDKKEGKLESHKKIPDIDLGLPRKKDDFTFISPLGQFFACVFDPFVNSQCSCTFLGTCNNVATGNLTTNATANATANANVTQPGTITVSCPSLKAACNCNPGGPPFDPNVLFGKFNPLLQKELPFFSSLSASGTFSCTPLTATTFTIFDNFPEIQPDSLQSRMSPSIPLQPTSTTLRSLFPQAPLPPRIPPFRRNNMDVPADDENENDLSSIVSNRETLQNLGSSASFSRSYANQNPQQRSSIRNRDEDIVDTFDLNELPHDNHEFDVDDVSHRRFSSDIYSNNEDINNNPIENLFA